MVTYVLGAGASCHAGYPLAAELGNRVHQWVRQNWPDSLIEKGYIEALHAHGTDNANKRKLVYSADHAWVFYNDDHLVERIVAEGNAEMTSTAETCRVRIIAASSVAGRKHNSFDILFPSYKK